MKNRTFALMACLLALIAVVLSASSSLGRSKSQPRGSYPLVSASATKKSGLKVRYIYADGTLQPGAADGFGLKCPKAAPNPISGYGGASEDAGVGKVGLLDSYPGTKRTWSVGMKNYSDQPQKYFVGVVCAK
jgi:hypothetical protein